LVYAGKTDAEARAYYLVIPHTNYDGTLCVLPLEATLDPDDPVGVLQAMLAAARDLLEDWRAGRIDGEFHDEVNAFWPTFTPFSEARLDLPSDHPDGEIHWWRDPNGKHYISPDPHRLERIAASRGAGAKPSFSTGIFLNLSGLVLPKDYPTTGRSFRDFICSRGGSYSGIATRLRAGGAFPVIMRFPPRPGARSPLPIELTVLLAPRVKKPANNPFFRAQRKFPGFREGHLPPELADAQLLDHQVHRVTSKRIDSAWLHFRGGSGTATKNLFQMTVCLIGCGSLGSAVARQLVREGVKHLHLVDGEILTWDNIGRHELGADRVDQNKATAMADTLNLAFPDLDVQASVSKWQAALAKNPQFFERFDLVISAAGEWAANAELNLLLFGRRPLQYIWTEPHGVAGHSLLLSGIGGCLACGFDRTGVFTHRVFDWAGDTQVKLPGCGGSFQPFSANDATVIAAMATRHALDFIGGKSPTTELRTRVNLPAPDRDATLRPEWMESVGRAPTGIFELRTPWNHEAACGICG
jgi:hypothetical protein